MKYDVDYFIGKFKAIPSRKIITDNQSDEMGNHCALGWCKRDDKRPYYCINTENSTEAFHLNELLINFGVSNESKGDMGWAIANLNNGNNKKYKQKTAKARLLAALYDIKKAQEPKNKTIIKYVAVSEYIRNEVPLTLEEKN